MSKTLYNGRLAAAPYSADVIGSTGRRFRSAEKFPTQTHTRLFGPNSLRGMFPIRSFRNKNSMARDNWGTLVGVQC